MDKIKYTGDLNDLITFVAEKVEDLYYISFQDECYKLNNKIFFTSYNKAKSNLVKHLYHNFCQGHYWHKNKNNTFSENMGWERNGGNVNKSDGEFKKMAKDLADTLLNNKIFKILKLNI